MYQQRNTLDFQGGRVLVIGDVMLDRSLFGSARRVSPEAPVPVVNAKEEINTAGGAANVAMNIASLGSSVTLCGLIGSDEAGERLRQHLEKENIMARLVTCPLPTITKMRILAQKQQLLRIDFEAPNYHEYASLLEAEFLTALNDCEVVVFSDYGKGTLTRVQPWIAQAKKAGKTVLVDPKGVDFSRYYGADIVTPNLSELKAAAKPFTGDIVDNSRELLLRAGIKALLVTRSEEGMTYVNAEREQHWAAQAREVFDVTGAGDTVIATLAAALSAGYPLHLAITFAGAAASVVVGKLGTATVSPSELQRTLEPQRAASHGIISQEELPLVIAHAREKGEKIVMTNGCFDILHAGHVTYLEEAKSLGDRLLVAVNSDDSVRRLKGKDRPANNLQSRTRVLAALAAVDWVVSFSEDTPTALIDLVAPDILVKGGDNQIENIPGADSVLARGGEVKVLSYVNGFSTTSTLAKYQK